MYHLNNSNEMFMIPTIDYSIVGMLQLVPLGPLHFVYISTGVFDKAREPFSGTLPKAEVSVHAGTRGLHVYRKLAICPRARDSR